MPARTQHVSAPSCSSSSHVWAPGRRGRIVGTRSYIAVKFGAGDPRMQRIPFRVVGASIGASERNIQCRKLDTISQTRPPFVSRRLSRSRPPHATSTPASSSSSSSGSKAGGWTPAWAILVSSAIASFGSLAAIPVRASMSDRLVLRCSMRVSSSSSAWPAPRCLCSLSMRRTCALAPSSFVNCCAARSSSCSDWSDRSISCVESRAFWSSSSASWSAMRAISSSSSLCSSRWVRYLERAARCCSSRSTFCSNCGVFCSTGAKERL